MIRGSVRLFIHSLFFAARSRKRALVFACVYALFACGVFFTIARFEHNNSVLLRQGAAVWLQETGGGEAPASRAEAMETYVEKEKLPVDRVVAVRYAELWPGCFLFSVDPEFPWAAASVNPGFLVEGRFPGHSIGEAVVSENFTFPMDALPDARIRPAVGSVVKLKERALRITGIMSLPDSLAEGLQMLIVSPDDFTLLAGDRDAYLKECIMIAQGSSVMPGLFGSTGKNVDRIQKSLAGQESLWSGKGLSRPVSAREAGSQQTRDALLFPLVLFGLLGSIGASLFYGYLAGRYRLREVAVLKTLGFNGFDISLYLVAEVVLIAAAGLVVSYIGVRLYFSVAVTYAQFELSSLWSILTAAVLLGLNILGFAITSRRARRVEPMTLFRNI